MNTVNTVNTVNAVNTVLAILLVLASASSSASSQPATQPASQPATQPASQPRFRPVDVFVDPKGQPLAAYQLEIVGEPQAVQLVGVEGGDHPAYREPPFYDPAALSRHRVILAALGEGSALPTARVRVARLHLRLTPDAAPPSVRLIVAAGADQARLQADVSLVPVISEPQEKEGTTP